MEVDVIPENYPVTIVIHNLLAYNSTIQYYSSTIYIAILVYDSESQYLTVL